MSIRLHGEKKLVDMGLSNNIYNRIVEKANKGNKQIAVLIDPDKQNDQALADRVNLIENSLVDYIFVGGSFLKNGLDKSVEIIKKYSSKPVIIFPGDSSHISSKADAILLLSLISGRNSEYLIGNHVLAAPAIKNAMIETISTGYILIDGGKVSSVQYISNTTPIPGDKLDIVCATALAGQMIGNKIIYLEAGSGAIETVNEKLIAAVKATISIPLIVGGGIKDVNSINQKFIAGADLVVLGNAVETNPNLLAEIKKSTL
jgi:phosphoglycerol geranylgeranyltransferase